MDEWRTITRDRPQRPLTQGSSPIPNHKAYLASLCSALGAFRSPCGRTPSGRPLPRTAYIKPGWTCPPFPPQARSLPYFPLVASVGSFAKMSDAHAVNQEAEQVTVQPAGDQKPIHHHDSSATLDEKAFDEKKDFENYKQGDIVEAGEVDEEFDEIARKINSVVPLTDDPNAPQMSFRAMFLGTIFGCILCACNNIFAFKTTQLIIPPTVAVLLSYPLGVFMAKALPHTKVFGLNLNPGPFTVKEHVLVSMIASAAGGGGGGIPYGMDNVVAQKLIGGQDIKFLPALAWIICSQFMGFGFAGLCRRFIIWPREMIWPGNLSQLALFMSFHQTSEEAAAEGGKYRMTRYKFFWIAVICIFVYEWIPLYIMPVLQVVSILCWIAPRDSYARMFGSASNGLGFLTFAFDWQYITSTWMTTPFFVTVLMSIGTVIFSWILPLIIFYTEPYEHAGHLTSETYVDGDFVFPDFNTGGLYDKDGMYVSKKKLYMEGFRTNETFVAEKGPFRISPYFLMNYVMSFFNLTALLSHIYLWHGDELVKHTRAMLKGDGRQGNDVHNRIMRNYSEVPDWVYFTILGVFFVGMIFVGEFTDFRMPWWSVFLATGIAALFMIPIGIIQALTGLQIGLNVVTEFVIGLILPGEVVTVICFKSFGYNVMIQAMSLLAALKLGHYLHIAPWYMLISQLWGTLIQAFLGTGVTFWIMDAWKTRILHNNNWMAQGYSLFFNAGAIWGAIAPKRFFSGPLAHAYWAFPLGMILPFLPYWANKRWPSKFWVYMNFPVISMSYGTWGAGLQNNYFWMTIITGYIFQFYLYRNKYEWWSKYNYILGAGLDTGNAIATVVIAFLSFSVFFPVWKGNPNPELGYYDYWCVNPELWKVPDAPAE
ncbi:OPT oligopeptide transporter protein-domain-containing protein [Fimicolochytrium jonesii]|uniref:OPT oligopeptide transporter protein-domain-containing protein n=1 Tax=Fimicolochytrium jonesii TaxID=1396493 RepID=UPI0022FDF481|nr:OPT oligopeptide transporter protein-domain-containing protein [Fimicolochytrium jonesii]KAI8819428.1 OPT oligopeptide transporter protein-domain-containing protein [Fimicolochytrium jonesii]